MTSKEWKKMQQDMYLFASLKNAVNVAVEYDNVTKILVVRSGITKFVAIVSDDGRVAINTWRFLGRGLKYEWKLVTLNGFHIIKTLWEAKR